MIYFRCRHCGKPHESSYQTPRALWKAPADVEVTDTCPTTRRQVIYRLRETLFRERVAE